MYSFESKFQNYFVAQFLPQKPKESPRIYMYIMYIAVKSNFLIKCTVAFSRTLNIRNLLKCIYLITLGTWIVNWLRYIILYTCIHWEKALKGMYVTLWIHLWNASCMVISGIGGVGKSISVVCIIAVHCIFGFSALGVLNIN